MLDTLAFGLVVPILPKLVVQFNGGDMASAARQVGLFSFVFAAMQFLFSPVIGSLSDRLGRRPIVLLSNLGMGCDYILMALAPSLSWLLVGRMISGLTSASFPTAMADITEPDKRAGKIACSARPSVWASSSAPPLADSWRPMVCATAAAALSLVNSCYGLFVLPESLSPEHRMKFGWSRANPLGSLKLPGRHLELWGIAVALFLHFIAHEALPSMFVIYTDYRYSWERADDRWRIGDCRSAGGDHVGDLYFEDRRPLRRSNYRVSRLAFGVLG